MPSYYAGLVIVERIIKTKIGNYEKSVYDDAVILDSIMKLCRK